VSTREIVLLDELPALDPEIFQAHPRAIACDCYVRGVETIGTPMPWGWSVAGGENIDHHAPVPAMAREVSSANLALRWIDEGGDSDGGPILLTHTDCDSVLSAGIAAGRLEPLERYGTAAIAADHTGAVDPIADLLQAIQETRDVEYSLDLLRRLEAGLPLPAATAAALDGRRRKRERAQRAVSAGAFTVTGRIWWAQFDQEMDGEFLPGLLPDGTLIVVGSPHPVHPERWAIKVRRGQAMPAGRTLDDLDLTRVDPNYGGRWNAGSTKRGGGSAEEVGAWVERLAGVMG
jgi:hypothetical protein